MSTFKKIRPKDVYVSSHLAKRRWEIRQATFEDVGILSGSFSSGSTTDSYWTSVNHLYYSNFENTEVQSGSYENYVQSTLSQFSSRSLAEDITLLSIPRSLYGTGIQPGTFSLQSGLVQIEDNSEGELYTGSLKVGDIIYPHGMIILSGSSTININEATASFNSRQPIHTINVHCKVLDSELTHTSNPSAMVSQSLDGLLSRSGGTYISSLTGSAFQPYVTTIGLYNDSNDLIAVAKLGRPTPKSQNTDTTFVIRLDM